MLIIIGVVGNFLPFYLISWSEQHIQSSTAGILMGVGPILTLILSHFFTKDDKFTVPKLTSICIGFIGLPLLCKKQITKIMKCTCISELIDRPVYGQLYLGQNVYHCE